MCYFQEKSVQAEEADVQRPWGEVCPARLKSATKPGGLGQRRQVTRKTSEQPYLVLGTLHNYTERPRKRGHWGLYWLSSHWPRLTSFEALRQIAHLPDRKSWEVKWENVAPPHATHIPTLTGLWRQVVREKKDTRAKWPPWSGRAPARTRGSEATARSPGGQGPKRRPRARKHRKASFWSRGLTGKFWPRHLAAFAILLVLSAPTPTPQLSPAEAVTEQWGWQCTAPASLMKQPRHGDIPAARTEPWHRGIS